MPVMNIMSKRPIVAQRGQTPSQVYQLMYGNKSIHHIPIVEDGKNTLIGIVSSTDFLKAMYNSIPIVEDIVYLDNKFPTIMDMVPSVIGTITTIRDTDSVHEAGIKLMSGNFHSLPVVDNDNHVVGIVTSTDLIEYLSNNRRVR
jgi:CBS domain-containing membrane protein